MVLRPGSYSIFLGTEMRAITVRFLLATSSSYSPLECAVKYSTHNTILLSCGCLAPARVLTVNLPTFFVFRGGLGYFSWASALQWLRLLGGGFGCCTFLGLWLDAGRRQLSCQRPDARAGPKTSGHLRGLALGGRDETMRDHGRRSFGGFEAGRMGRGAPLAERNRGCLSRPSTSTICFLVPVFFFGCGVGGIVGKAMEFRIQYGIAFW